MTFLKPQTNIHMYACVYVYVFEIKSSYLCVCVFNVFLLYCGHIKPSFRKNEAVRPCIIQYLKLHFLWLSFSLGMFLKEILYPFHAFCLANNFHKDVQRILA